MARYREQWNLESIFPGGSGSPEFRTFLNELKQAIADAAASIENASCSLESGEIAVWEDTLTRVQSALTRTKEASSFVVCLLAEDTRNGEAKTLRAEVRSLQAAANGLQGSLEQLLARMPSAAWHSLAQQPSLRVIWYGLSERRREAALKMNPQCELLAEDLAVDGYHGWGDHYMAVAAGINIQWDGRELSTGQANNLLSRDSRMVRSGVFQKLQDSWHQQADVIAGILNHLAGFRLNLYAQRGWKDVLAEPLRQNRMTPETLDRVEEAVETVRPHLVSYLQAKADLLAVPQLDWYDLGASVGSHDRTWTFEQAGQLILDAFASFSPALAATAERALTEGWIDAAERQHKRSGGLCTSFPCSAQSRISMNFAGTAANVMTLAHELGHAYHQCSMAGIPHYARRYPISLAEAAATSAEMVVADRLIKDSQNAAAELELLDAKLRRAVTFVLTAWARFVFERRFYDVRRSRRVSSQELDGMMLAAQRETFGDALHTYEPKQWASRLFFYYTAVPFYNFPYTFGCLLSTALTQQRAAVGSGFGDAYHQFLRGSGSMDIRQLLEVSFGLDVHADAFWKAALAPLQGDVQRFVELAARHRGG